MSRTIVIGAGVIGLACAYELQRRGERVTILDRGEPGAGCSSGNSGWIVPALSGPVPAPGLLGTSLRWLLKADSPLYIRPRADLQFLGWLWDFRRHCTAPAHRAGLEAVAALNARTMELYDALEKDGVQIEMHRQGVLFAFLGRPALEHIARDLEQMRAFGYAEPVRLTAREVREVEPLIGPSVIGGILAEGERHVRPETLTAGLLRRLREGGADVRSGVEVSGLRRRGRAVTAVETVEGVLEADRVVIAAGAWSGVLASGVGYRLPIQAGKGYSITLTHPEASVRRPLYLDEARIAVSNFDGALRLGGTMELSGLDPALDMRRIEAVRRGADRYLLGWGRGEREVAWAGMRPLTPDGLPVIGSVPGVEGLYIATGHGMLGVTLAPATAFALAELVTTGRSSVSLSAFDPGRFARRH
jgi:D-amino-acid dehydrogenase